MIKTVSFAPPRGSSGSRSGAKTAGVKVAPVEVLRPDNPRAASGRATGTNSVRKNKAPAQTSLELLFDAPEEVPIATPIATKVARTKKESSAPLVSEKPPAPAAKSIGAIEVRAKKPRVPKDLAAQYGEKVVVRTAAPPVEVEVAKKRLTKIERQARRDLIKPSEGLLERLARVNQIAARKPPGEPRGKGWKFVCGRCGTTSFFQTPGGLCACGTIAVKEN